VTASPNKHGVYPDAETLTLPLDKKRWQGIPQAEIALCPCEDGWRGAVSFSFMCGDHRGSFSPIFATSPAYPSRADALAAMIERLCERVSGVTHPEMVKVARRIEEWARGLVPMQADLFGAAA
jgi:hypothetical protein